MPTDIWVTKKGDSWTVRREGDDAPLSKHRTQAEALDAARPIAKADHVELVWQGETGAIQGRDSYGNDPRSKKG